MVSNRGSEWQKWDLHLHTPNTKLANNYKCETEDVWEKYCRKLNESDVQAFGITDYFSIENYVLLLEKYKKAYPECKKLFLPNIEFRIDSKNKDNEHIQLHLIFSNSKIVLDKIESFFNRLALVSTDDVTLTSKYCNPNDLGEIGYGKAMVKIDILLKQLEADFSKNEYLIVGLARGYGSLRPGRNDSRGGEYAKELDKNFNIFFGNSEDSLFYLNEVEGRAQYNLKDKAVICGSDAHSFEELENKLGKSFEHRNEKEVLIAKSEVLWIKSELSFEGLRQIVYEPEQRVKIQPVKPDFKENKLIIDEVRYYSSENLFTPKKISLNSNLNVIVGGKSSGKSILLYNIAATLETNEEVTSITNDKYDFRKDDENFNFEVKSLSGISQKLFDETENSIIPNIKYIPQNYLTKLAEPKANKKGEELLKYVRGLLLEDETYKNYYKDFIEILKSNDKKREELIDNFFSIKDSITTKEKEVKEKGNEEVLNKSVQSNLLKISELKKSIGLTEEEIAAYNTEKVKLEQIQSDRIKISNDYRKVVGFNRDTLNSLRDLKNKKQVLEKSLEIESSKNLINEKFGFLEEVVREIDEFGKTLELNKENKLDKESLFRTLLLENSKEEKRLKTIIEPLIKNEKVKEQITGIDKIISDDRKKIQAIEQLKIEIKNSKEELAKEKSNVFELYVENSKEYDRVILKLNERTKLLEEQNLEIIGKCKFNFRKFIKNFLNISDGRSFPEKEYEILQHKADLIDFDVQKELKELEALFDVIVKGDFPLNTKANKKAAIKILLDDYFVDYWETEYDGDKMGEMSTGKASFVILMLIVGLSSSKAPILIDQPEDNLDNRSITKDLVTYLRDKKSERQIILVTHNPNVVVNADAENVIVANQKGQNDKETSSPYKFDYINGAIENTKEYDEKEKDLLKSMGIREHIADIVEGGKTAFKKREVKYGFK